MPQGWRRRAMCRQPPAVPRTRGAGPPTLLLCRRRHLDLRDRQGVVFHRAADGYRVAGVRLQTGEVLVGDAVDLVALTDEDVLGAALDTGFDALLIGHLLRAMLAVRVFRVAHGIADLALPR